MKFVKTSLLISFMFMFFVSSILCNKMPKPIQTTTLSSNNNLNHPSEANPLQETSGNCFTQTVEEYYLRVKAASADLESACGLTIRYKKLVKLYELIEDISDMEAKLKYKKEEITEDYLHKLESDALEAEITKNSLNAAIQTYRKTHIFGATAKQISEIFTALYILGDESIKLYCSSKKITGFPEELLLKGLKYRRQVSYLENMMVYGINKTECLPVNFEVLPAAIAAKDVSETNDITVNTKTDSYFSWTHKQCQSHTNQIDLDLDNQDMSVAMYFWVYESVGLVKAGPITIFDGVLQNKEIHSYKIKLDNSQEEYGLIHEAKFITTSINAPPAGDNNEEIISVKSKSKCAGWVFVIISFERECDHYNARMTFRFPGFNFRYSKAFSLPYENVNDLNIRMNMRKANSNQHFLFLYLQSQIDYKYTTTNELLLMTQDQDKIPKDEIEECLTILMPPMCFFWENSSCGICQKTKYKYKTQCLDICPDGTYYTPLAQGQTEIGKECHDCQIECTKCTSITECTNCKSPLKLIKENMTCLPVCPNGHFAVARNNNVNDLVCNECVTNCKICLNKDKCSECDPGYFEINGECVSNCPDKYYENYGNINKCMPCEGHCIVCKSGTECTQCDGHYLLT